ncbi:YkoF-like protein [Triangularia verruculosa]|uniref:YkoF-like protein n=1 Tax=Triangularia verruculosa TaxID=2587418 RepID=A0AAN6XF38_9PEZI|nr:YkoF-like protein [Triangularia verruculosa]
MSRITTKSHLLKPLLTTTTTRTFTTTTRKMTDYKNLPTPSSCYADFCLIPVGTPTSSVSKEIALVQAVIRDSGIKHTMHSAGTTLEGSWDEVYRVIGQAHTIVHQSGILRVQSSLRTGSRTDKVQSAEDKVKKVEDILAAGKQ